MNSDTQELLLKLIDFRGVQDSKDILRLLNCIDNEEEFLDFIKVNRINGIIYKVLSEMGLFKFTSEKINTCLSELHYKNIQQNKNMLRILSELPAILNIQEYKYAMLKGSYLIPHMYEEGLRTSNDIDILISQKDIDKIDKDLSSKGFIQKVYKEGQGLVEATRKEKLFVRMNFGELVPYFKDYIQPGLETAIIDINISLDFKAKDSRNLVEDLLKNIIQYNIDDKVLYTLDNIHFFIQLCTHLYKEAKIYNWVIESRDSLLYKYCDIYIYLLNNHDREYYKKLAEYVNRYELNRECYYSVVNTMQIFSSLQEYVYLNEFINLIKPQKLKFMNQISWPLEKKLYEYDIEFSKWVFLDNKLSYLREIPNNENDIYEG